MNFRLILCLLLLPLFSFSQTPTRLVVRAKAKDAKFIGTSVGSALILIKDAETGELLAEGLTRGGTGNTSRIMSDPKGRYDQLSQGGAAHFTAEIALEEPRLLTVEAHSPYTNRQARMVASTQVWLIPGKHIEGDGLILEIPGFIIDVLAPRTHQFLSLSELEEGALTVRANIVMMCGCTISNGGLWDGSQMEVEAQIKYEGEPAGRIKMDITETANVFEGNLPIEQPGNYELIVQAFDPRTGNTGVDKVNFVVD